MDADWSDDERGVGRMPRRPNHYQPARVRMDGARTGSPCGALGRDICRSIAKGPSPVKQTVEYVDYEFEGAGKAAGAVWGEADGDGWHDAPPPGAPDGAEDAHHQQQQHEGGPEPPMPPKHQYQAYT